MVSKSDFQQVLKERYGVNKNINGAIAKEDYEFILDILQHQPSMVRLIEVFLAKNNELGKSNRLFGGQRYRAEEKFSRLQEEHQQLEKAIVDLKQSTTHLSDLKAQLKKEHQNLEGQVQTLLTRNQTLTTKVQTLSDQTEELSVANTQLKKDNKDLKNLVDQIRLRLAQDTKKLLQYEDSEIRKALIRLFRQTLG
jgi:uncharacterized protein (DUF3084 family)